jgi:tRNA(His) 5'-end guanylyltransferase
MNDQLGDRMKCYENVSRNYLIRRVPVIMRLDGKAFSTLTRRTKCVKPWDIGFAYAISEAMKAVMKEIDGAKLGYCQSDEISILITDYENLTTEPWFAYNIQKMTSVAASIASTTFSKIMQCIGWFDCRVFNIGKEEVPNYFIWRQRDCSRNSILTMAQSLFSHKDLMNKNTKQLQTMIFDTGNNWDRMLTCFKYGTVMTSRSPFYIYPNKWDYQYFEEQYGDCYL